MCFILTVVFMIATYTFYTSGLMIQAVLSGILAALALIFFIRKLILNGRCIFGKSRDC